MTEEEFKKKLIDLNINITNEQLAKLNLYKSMLQEYNKKFNLTAIIKDEDIYLKHFYDSLTLNLVVDLKKSLNILDIGTGAGFPGLVLKIIFPNLKITLLDSNNKKIYFLKEVISKLNLKEIEAINNRAELLESKYREYFDLVTSRAVAHLRILAELAIPYVKVDGNFIAMKGEKEEINESLNTIDKLNSKITEIKKIYLPSDNVRTLIIITKKQITNIKYPRKYDQIVKQEIK